MLDCCSNSEIHPSFYCLTNGWICLAALFLESLCSLTCDFSVRTFTFDHMFWGKVLDAVFSKRSFSLFKTFTLFTIWPIRTQSKALSLPSVKCPLFYPSQYWTDVNSLELHCDVYNANWNEGGCENGRSFALFSPNVQCYPGNPCRNHVE